MKYCGRSTQYSHLVVNLSVPLVYCGQTVGWIKMKLGMEVGLSPSYIVLDSDPPKRGTLAQPPHFSVRPCLLWPNGWMDQLPLGMEVRLGPGHAVKWGAKGHSPPIFGPSLLWIVLDGDPAPPKRSTAPPLLFGSCVLLPNGWMDQDATWYGGGPQPRPHCVKWAPSSPQKGSQQPPPLFRPCLFWPNGCPSQLLVSIWFYSYLLSCCILHIILPLIKSFN